MPDSYVKVWLLGNSAGAVQAMEETAVASEATSRRVVASGRRQEAAFSGVTKASKGMFRTFGLSPGLIGAGGLVFGLKKAVDASKQWQASQAQLRLSLGKTGDHGSKSLKELSDAAERLSTKGGFDASTQVQGITQFVTELGSAKKAWQENVAVTDLARNRTTGYADALSMVEKAQIGQTRGLKTVLGPTFQVVTKHVDALRERTRAANLETRQQTALFKAAHPGVKLLAQGLATVSPQALKNAKTLDQQATAAKINTLIIQKLGGATAAYSRGAQGSVSNAKNEWDLLARTLGDDVLPVYQRLAKTLGSVAGFLAQHKTLTKDLLIGLGAGGAAFGVKKLLGRSAAKTLAGEAIARGATPMNPLYVLDVGTGSGKGWLRDAEKAAKDAGKVGGGAGGATLASRFLPRVLGAAKIAGPATAFAYGSGLFGGPFGSSTQSRDAERASLSVLQARRVAYLEGHPKEATPAYITDALRPAAQKAVEAYFDAHPITLHHQTVLNGRILAEEVHRYKLKAASHG